jgi:hypothetical protein
MPSPYGMRPPIPVSSRKSTQRIAEEALALNCSARSRGVDDWFLDAMLRARRGAASAPAGQFRRPLR